MSFRQQASFSFDYDNVSANFYRRYGLWEPLAMGYADGPEMIGLGESPTTCQIPREAFEYIVISYLRLHGYLVVPQKDIQIVYPT